MDNTRKERLMISIITISAAMCFVESYIADWEYWVPPLILFGQIGIWWIHIRQKLMPSYRSLVYYIYTALIVFYFGVHPDMAFDISVVVMLFLATFTMLDNARLLNYIIIEEV